MDTKPTKLRKVKTITRPRSCARTFDEEVNEALAEGWYLVRRYTLPSYHGDTPTVLVAELQRYDEYDE